MLYFETNNSSSGPYWSKKEQTVSECVSLMTGTVVSHNYRTSTSLGNPLSCAQVNGNGNMSSVLTG